MINVWPWHKSQRFFLCVCFVVDVGGGVIGEFFVGGEGAGGQGKTSSFKC